MIMDLQAWVLLLLLLLLLLSTLPVRHCKVYTEGIAYTGTVAEAFFKRVAIK